MTNHSYARPTGRLDGHSLYSAEHAAASRELPLADRRPVRPAARQLGRRCSSCWKLVDDRLDLSGADDCAPRATGGSRARSPTRCAIWCGSAWSAWPAGYADCKNAARLADDPIHKLLLDRDPLAGPALGSQPTLSRFENAWGRRELIRVGHCLARTVIAHHRRRLHGRARRITIDLDPTDDPTHGQQELTFFNGHYDTACYLPLVATADLRRRTHPVPGRDRAAAGQRGRRARGHRPAARGCSGPCVAPSHAPSLRVRLDGGFAGPRLLAFLDRAGVEYVVGLPGNPRLDTRIRRLLGRARVLFRTTGQATAVFGETRYAAKSWGRKRRVIMKAEVVQYPGRAPRDNPRFVVSNLTLAPEAVYAVYRQRGDVENRLQGAQGQPGPGAHQLPALPGQPGPRPADGDGLHPVPDAAAARAGHGLRGRPGRHPAGASDQARGVDHPIGAPDRCCTCHAPIPGSGAWRQLARAVGARAG